MEEKVKQRLIGVLVIVGALFIILPFLFHNSRPTLSQNAPSNGVNQPNSPSVSVTLPAAESTTSTTPAAPVTTASTTPAPQPQQNTQQPTVVSAVNTAANNTAPVNTPAPTTTPAVNTAPVVTAANTVQQPIQTPSVPAAPAVKKVAAIATASAPVKAVKTAKSNTQQPAVTAAPASATTPATTTVADNTAMPSTTFSGTQATSTDLTTGQANEGPAQAPGQPSIASMKNTAAVSAPSTPSDNTAATYKPVHRTVVAAKVEKREVRTVSHVEKAQKTEKSAFVSRPAVGSWIIQLAAFSDKSNATHLISKLRAHQFDAYTHTVRRNEKTITIVFVGPEANMQKAESVQRQLRERFNLNGVVKKA